MTLECVVTWTSARAIPWVVSELRLGAFARHAVPFCESFGAEVARRVEQRRGEAEHFNPSHPLESVARGAPTVRAL